MSDYSRPQSYEEVEHERAQLKLHNAKMSLLINNGLTFAELKGLLYSNRYANDHPDTRRLKELTKSNK